jgi:hypothetical protein
VASAVLLASAAWFGYGAARDTPPFSAATANLRATIVMTTVDRFEQDAAQIDVTGLNGGPDGEGWRQFVGRLDFDVPEAAHAAGSYLVLFLHRQTGQLAQAYGTDGASWGPSIEDLVQLDPSLGQLRDQDPMAVSTPTDHTGPLAFSGSISGPDLTPADLRVVVIFEGPERELYWIAEATVAAGP